MTETKVQIAVDLLPLFQHLYKGGVLSIGPGDEVHLRPALFHGAFPEVEKAIPRKDSVYPWQFVKFVTIGGRTIRFFALSEREDWDAGA